VKWRRLAVFVGLVAVVATSACHGSPAPVVEPTPGLHPNWQLLTLPVPAGSRAVLRSSATCAGRWYLAGSTVTGAGAASPAIWTSTDLRTWTTLPINPVSFYGKQNTIGILGCQADHVAGIGWQVGGAHGFPRYSGWYPDASGELQEVDIPYTLFAGTDGVNIRGIAVSDRGWVLSGNRSSGAATWHSPDGHRYTIVEGDPQVASTDAHYTWAGGVVATPTGFLMVGALTPRAGANRDPAVWTSPDGATWTPVPVPGTPAYEDPSQVTVSGSSVVTIGLRDTGYGVWRGPVTGGGSATGGWSRVGQFGDNGSGNGTDTALVSTAGHLFTTFADASAYSLWESDDLGSQWRTVSLPAAAPSKADTFTFVVSDQRQLLLVIDDGRSTRVWLDPEAPAGR
jgi:hypothetical protein